MVPGGGTPGRADPFLVSVHREIPTTPGIGLVTLRELVDGPSSADEPTEEVLTVWEDSANDGSVPALRETPLTLLR